MMFCVLFVCLLNRDFGCMLSVEKKQRSKQVQQQSMESGDDDDDDVNIIHEKKPLLRHIPLPEVDDSLFEGERRGRGTH